MQNGEFRRKIQEIQKDTHDVKEKQIKVKYEIEKVYNEMFIKNDTLKLYDKTIKDLSRAVEVEKSLHQDLLDQIKQMKSIVNEE